MAVGRRGCDTSAIAADPLWRSPTAMRPQRSPRYIEHQLRDAACFRMSRRNIGRQLIFAPYLVVKVGMNPAEQRRLACEAAASQAAAAHPFWQGGALRAWRLWGVGLAARRGRPARLDDYDRVRAFVDRRLELAGRYPRAAIAALLARAPLHARLSRERRAAMLTVAGDGALPMTSMHGDLHLFNFATLDDGLRLLDWEHFEPAGSFAYDAVDFEMASLREDLRRGLGGLPRRAAGGARGLRPRRRPGRRAAGGAVRLLPAAEDRDPRQAPRGGPRLQRALPAGRWGGKIDRLALVGLRRAGAGQHRLRRGDPHRRRGLAEADLDRVAGQLERLAQQRELHAVGLQAEDRRAAGDMRPELGRRRGAAAVDRERHGVRRDRDPDVAAHRQALLEAEQREIDDAGERARHVGAGALPGDGEAAGEHRVGELRRLLGGLPRLGVGGAEGDAEEAELGQRGGEALVDQRELGPAGPPAICSSSRPLPIAPIGLIRSWQSRALTSALRSGEAGALTGAPPRRGARR